MTLTPEQIAEGWRLHDGSDVCPIKDNRTKFRFIQSGSQKSDTIDKAGRFYWQTITAYRIIEAHGADAEPARPTPYPNGYDDLVFDADGWSQTIIVDGKRPEWLRDDDTICPTTNESDYTYQADRISDWWLAIRVRRREPKRETVTEYVSVAGNDILMAYDLIDGKPDLSTLKIAEDAL